MAGRIRSILLSLVLIICLGLSKSALAQSDFFIKSIVPDKSGKTLFLGGSAEQALTYNVVRLSEPDRLVVDINNAVLTGKKSIIKIKNEKIDKVKIAQFSTSPNVVRLVFEVNSPDVFDKIDIKKYKNSLIFCFDEVVLAKVATPSIYKDKDFDNTSQEKDLEPQSANKEPMVINLQEDNINSENKKTNDLSSINLSKIEKNIEKSGKAFALKSIQEQNTHNIVINTVKALDNRILISGAGIISLKEPFLLEDPSRIIFDIVNSVVDSEKLLSVFRLSNKDIVRIGQFDDNTVRVVLETDTPELYQTIISPDLQSCIIADKNNISFEEFPVSKAFGEIQDIKVFEKNDKTTKITLISTKPIVHNLKRLYAPDRGLVEFYNLAVPSEELLSALAKTGQFHGFQLEASENKTGQSKWSFPLNRTTVIESRLSLDGRIFELTLSEGSSAGVGKLASIKRKIILDPGHGGYDPGANRDGIFEKDIALDVAKRVKKYLKQSGFNVLMTRNDDSTVSLKERMVLANKEKPDAFISIHVNASKNPKIKGLETHWYTMQSKSLAMEVQNQMVNNLVVPDRGIKNSRFYVIRNTQVPSILAEIGYLSNDKERAQIMTEERKEATAKAIADGIIGYLYSRSSPSSAGNKKL